jgi:hypothetical protein
MNQKKMHAYIYIYNAQEEVEIKFSCIIELQRKKEYVMYVDNGRVIVVVCI